MEPAVFGAEPALQLGARGAVENLFGLQLQRGISLESEHAADEWVEDVHMKAFCTFALLSTLSASATWNDGDAGLGLEPRLMGQCTIDGPCARFPDQGGRRDDNQQGYLIFGAGISAEHCALRARDHHAWCGNHPDAAVYSIFERESRGLVENAWASFPPVATMHHATSSPLSSRMDDESGIQCTESYQLARGSRWSEFFCDVEGGRGGEGVERPDEWSLDTSCATDEHQVSLQLQALTDTSVLFCTDSTSNGTRTGEKMWCLSLSLVSIS